MAFAVAVPAESGTISRRAPLALAILLHGSLLLALTHGLQPPLERPQPREVLISLLPQPSERSARPPKQTSAAPTLPKQAQPVPLLPLPIPQRAPEPQLRPAIEPQPAAPAMREAPAVAPVPTPAPVVPAAAQHSAPQTHEARPAPPPPAPAPVAAPAPAAVPVQAAAPAERAPVSVSGVEYLAPPKPDYPLASKRLGEQGKVMLRLLIDEKGHAERIEVQQSSGYSRLDEAARAAVLRAAFKPHLEDGRPVPVYVTVPISFSLR